MPLIPTDFSHLPALYLPRTTYCQVVDPTSSLKIDPGRSTGSYLDFIGEIIDLLWLHGRGNIIVQLDREEDATKVFEVQKQHHSRSSDLVLGVVKPDETVELTRRLQTGRSVVVTKFSATAAALKHVAGVPFGSIVFGALQQQAGSLSRHLQQIIVPSSVKQSRVIVDISRPSNDRRRARARGIALDFRASEVMELLNFGSELPEILHRTQGHQLGPQ